jgi:ubiquinone/menaquinone biosynthesis C-methylase UbiE
MCHVRYDLWHKLIKKICSNYFHHIPPSIFEIGGGTGSLAKMLIKSGYSYTGSDLSFNMCKQAQGKAIPFICTDALSLPIKHKFSFVIFLYDGINYLKSIKEYSLLFQEVSNTLITNGLFLFDITTENNSITNFYNHVDAEDFGNSSYIRNSYYDKRKKRQYNDFAIFTAHHDNNMVYIKEYEYHIQQIFSVNEIVKAIPRNLFNIEGIWDNFTFNRYHTRSERIHFLLKKTV